MFIDAMPSDDLRIVHAQVFFVADKANPGWSVVLQKEARGRRIISKEDEHCLGQEESSGDRDVFTALVGERQEAGDENESMNGTQPRRRERQTSCT